METTRTQFRVLPMCAIHAAEVATLSGQLGYPATRAEILRRLEGAGPERTVLVAIDEQDHVLGWAEVLVRRLLVCEPFAELGGLVVAEGARRRGVGGALLAAAEAWACERGMPRMRIRSNIARVEARPFYEGHGYAVTKTSWNFDRALES